MAENEGVVLVTGVTGTLGTRLAKALSGRYTVVGVDLDCDGAANCYSADLTSREGVEEALGKIEREFGHRLASVVHLAAYFDFTGEPSPLYQTVNVEGTRLLLHALGRFSVDQFLYSSTMLVHAATVPGIPITEDSPLGAKWAYPESKLATERVIDEDAATLWKSVRRKTPMISNALPGPFGKVWLMCTRLIFDSEPPMANADHLLGALVVTVSVTAFAEIARPARYLNGLFGACLLATPWMYDRGSPVADWASVASGFALIALSMPRGRISGRYGSWNRYLV